MKLQLSMIMMAALAHAVFEGGYDGVPSVWNNWNNDPANMPEINGNTLEAEIYHKRKEYFVNNPLN